MELPALLAKLYLLYSSLRAGETPSQDVSSPSSPSPSASASLAPRPYTILVEGNVGCGKTTTLEYFRNRSDVDIVFEPVGRWQNISGVDLLQNIADDATRWGGTFQLYSSLTRYQNLLRPTQKQLRLMERSIYSERYCFLEASHAAGKKPGGHGISDAEYALMDRWFHTMTKNLWQKVKPDVILYIRCDIPVLLERIRKRGRPEEAHIPVDFLEDIQRRHDDWLMYKNSTFPAPARVVVLDGNLPLEEFHHYLSEKEGQILAEFV